jgi:hypothetical protein
MEASDLAANAARSNLTSFKTGDRVYIAHQRLPIGRLHQATVAKVVNASVHFEPPLAGLLKDPSDPAAGELHLAQPLAAASSSNCLPEMGGNAEVQIEEFTRDGATWKRLTWRHLDGSTTTREVPPARTSWQPLDYALLRELEEAAR